jgi:hypothetical protein
MKAWAVLLSCLLFVAAKGEDVKEREALLIGAWSCETGLCPDDEVEFALEDGERIYNSWIHNRPGVAGARWKLSGNDLTVTHASGLGYRWRVVRLSATALVLYDKDQRREVGFKRLPD